jgi:tetratricopeptide (TPR) repeat protein
MLLVAALAFLLASFPAHNSDVLLHLARGRLLARGQSPAADNPDLAYGVWANQTWLYDLCCYGCTSLLGGAGLVLAKALLAAGIGLLLLRHSRNGSGWALAAVCTSLALVAMSPHLLLQPATVSCFLLALAVSYLGRSAAVGEDARPAPWLLLPLFVAWANLDRWFLLGLGVVGLVWLGEVLDDAFSDRTPGRWPAELGRRGMALLALAAACLLNPSFRHAFTLAEEWHTAVSPFAGVTSAGVVLNPARLAYFLLLGLSLLSFAAAFPQWRWRRFLPWLGLGLASAFGVLAIPFFAVVAGPVLAWNLQDALAQHFAWARGEVMLPPSCRLGRGLAAVLVVVLVVCAWPGWLQGSPFGPRRWALDLPPSLERGADAVRHLRQEGTLAAESGGLHLCADTVFAFAWFCPEEKRVQLSSQDYPAEGRRRMRAGKIDHVLVYGTDRDLLAATLGGLAADPEQWPLLYEEGGLAIFGWRDPAQPGSVQRFRDRQVDLTRLAFHPADNKKAPSEGPEAKWPARSWWEAFWKPAPAPPADRQEALMHLLHAEALQHLAPLRHLSRWESSQAAGLVGAATGWTPATSLYDAPLRLELFRPYLPTDGGRPLPPAPLDQMVLSLQQGYVRQRDDVPPPHYYLAVRAARRAVAANPDDAVAYELLGEGYLGLLNATRERAWGGDVPKLVHIRLAQASAALNRALDLRPDLPRAHLLLSRLYHEMGYLDLELRHFQDFCRLDREAGPPPGASPEQASARLARQVKDIESLEREVEKRESRFTLAAKDLSPRDRPLVAFENGLAGKALELLLESHLAAFGTEGMDQELKLLLGVGRARDVQEWLSPEHEAALGPASYHWFLAQAAAALGDYSRAQDECVRASEGLGLRPGASQPMRFREGMALLVAKLLLDEQTGGGAPPSDLRTPLGRVEFSTQIRTLAGMLRQQAELTVLRGLLALEEGDVDEAESAFRTAFDVWKDRAAAASGAGLDFNGRRIAATCLGWLTVDR